ncbi:MAG: group III truncated hemoglobin [Lentilitoribacter sp.]
MSNSPNQIRATSNLPITHDQIALLVDEFYQCVRKDPQLGPIFERVIDGNWEPHLIKMKSFWRSVLLKTGEYKGQPVPKHNQIEGLQTEDFLQWLELFSVTAKQIFDETTAHHVMQTAERIASSLWLSQNKDPFQSPPEWKSELRKIK